MNKRNLSDGTYTLQHQGRFCIVENVPARVLAKIFLHQRPFNDCRKCSRAGSAASCCRDACIPVFRVACRFRP